MSANPAPRPAIADIARQARELLASARDSRWPGFEAEPKRTEPPQGAGGGAPAPPARPQGSPRRPSPAAPRAAAPQGPHQPPAPAAHPSAIRTAPPGREPNPWGSLEQIARAVGACTKCPLHATRSNTVPGEGNPSPQLLFVGEAPGADEDRLGRPFVGAAGRKLDDMIRAMGLARGEVFIANVLKCRPPGNRTPLPAEIAACTPYLRAQIELLGPQVICALGTPAAQTLLGTAQTISRLRGRFSSSGDVPVMPTFHPSYLLRNPGAKKLAWQDLQQIMQRLNLTQPGVSRAPGEP